MGSDFLSHQAAGCMPCAACRFVVTIRAARVAIIVGEKLKRFSGASVRCVPTYIMVQVFWGFFLQLCVISTECPLIFLPRNRKHAGLQLQYYNANLFVWFFNVQDLRFSPRFAITHVKPFGSEAKEHIICSHFGCVAITFITAANTVLPNAGRRRPVLQGPAHGGRPASARQGELRSGRVSVRKARTRSCPSR